jgi:hypothetical protein
VSIKWNVNTLATILRAMIMKKLNFIFVTIFFTFIQCDKSEDHFNPLIHGKWQLIEVYGALDNKELGWIPVSGLIEEGIEFHSDGIFYYTRDDVRTCKGKYELQSGGTINLVPQDCHPLSIPNIETIHMLTEDTLIISNKRDLTSSFLGRRDKYIRMGL